jgi:hypothetical protein
MSEFNDLLQILIKSDFNQNPRNKFFKLISKEKSKTNPDILLEIILHDNNFEQNAAFYMKQAFVYTHEKMIFELTDLRKAEFETNKISYLANLLNGATSSQDRETSNNYFEDIEYVNHVANLYFSYFGDTILNANILQMIIIADNHKILQRYVDNGTHTWQEIIMLACENFVISTEPTAYVAAQILPFGRILNMFVEHIDDLSTTAFSKVVQWCSSRGTWTDKIIERLDDLSKNYESKEKFENFIASCLCTSIFKGNGQIFKIWMEIHPDYNVSILLKHNPTQFSKKIIFQTCFDVLQDKISLDEQVFETIFSIIKSNPFENIPTGYLSIIKIGIESGLVSNDLIVEFLTRLQLTDFGKSFSAEDFNFYVDHIEAKDLDKILWGQISTKQVLASQSTNRIKYLRVKYLLEKGANPNKDKGYLLLSTIFALDYPILKLLVEYGGDLNLVRDAINQIDFQQRDGITNFYPKNFNPQANGSMITVNHTNSEDIRMILDSCVCHLESNNYEIRGEFFERLQQEFFDNKFGPGIEIAYVYEHPPYDLHQFVEETLNHPYQNVEDEPDDAAISEDFVGKLFNSSIAFNKPSIYDMLLVEIESNGIEFYAKLIQCMNAIIRLSSTSNLLNFCETLLHHIKQCIKFARGDIFVHIIGIFAKSEQAIDLIRETINEMDDDVEHLSLFSNFLDFLDKNLCADFESNVEQLTSVLSFQTQKQI